MKTFAQKVIEFNRHIHFEGSLPDGVAILNPFRDDPHALELSTAFYKKYYNDMRVRSIILGINPGRFGAGLTGVPFTDTKRLQEICGIAYPGKSTHEPSCTFIYEMIDAFGGPEKFYGKFYINSVCPLGFTRVNEKGRPVNYNYYDDKALTESVYDFIMDNLQTQINLGVNTTKAFCFGTGKNETFLRKLNDSHHFFDNIIALEHPRYIMQYKAKQKSFYIDKYLVAFEGV